MQSIRWAISGFAITLSASLGAAPSVTLVAPATQTRYIAPAAIELVANPTVDAGRTVERVEFLADGDIIGVATQAPYTFNWTNVAHGNYALRARVFDSQGRRDASPVVRVRVRDNKAPHVRILTPDNRETFPAPASIAVSLFANDRDDNLTNVELFANGAPLATFAAAPYDFDWTNVAPGTYALTARATDDLGLTTTSRTKTITVTGSTPPPPEPKGYFIHVDHLNTPRLIADEHQRTVWRWDQAEPFGDSVPNANPSGLGVFEFPRRLAGQYFDGETGLHYNYFRDYNPAIGRYIVSDPIGLAGGLNTYAYALADPLGGVDMTGLAVTLLCRPVGGMGQGKSSYVHCYVEVTCPDEGWGHTYSMFGSKLPFRGYKEKDAPDDALSGSVRIGSVTASSCSPDVCAYEKSIRNRFNAFPSGNVYYRMFGPNSNSFTYGLLQGNLPAGTPSPLLAPGIDIPHPSFIK